MKKGINLLRIIYLLLIVVIMVLSLMNCSKIVSDGYEGLVIQEQNDGTAVGSDLNGKPITLPEPKYKNWFFALLPGYIFCAAAFWFKKLFINVCGCIAAFFQCLFSGGSVLFVNLMEDMISTASCGIGRLITHREFTPIGCFVFALTIICFAFSILLTFIIRKDKIYGSQQNMVC